MTTPAVHSLERAIDLLLLTVEDDGARPLAELAAELGIAFSTAHRLRATLEARGLVTRLSPGRFVAGPALVALAGRIDPAARIARIAGPAMRRLSRGVRRTVHLGVLEDAMVTYLAKEARDDSAGFTREGMQLEAYCSGIGKVLLAHLDRDARERYLADGPFVALTANTIVDPARLRAHLDAVRAQGWAIDDAEVFEGLTCIAAPVRGPDGAVVAAISISSAGRDADAALAMLAPLRAAIAAIEARLTPHGRAPPPGHGGG